MRNLLFLLTSLGFSSSLHILFFCPGQILHLSSTSPNVGFLFCCIAFQHHKHITPISSLPKVSPMYACWCNKLLFMFWSKSKEWSTAVPINKQMNIVYLDYCTQKSPRLLAILRNISPSWGWCFHVKLRDAQNSYFIMQANPFSAWVFFLHIQSRPIRLFSQLKSLGIRRPVVCCGVKWRSPQTAMLLSTFYTR